MELTARVDHYIHSVGETNSHQVLHKLNLILQELTTMSAEQDRLMAAVERNTDLDNSIITMSQGMAEMLRTLAAEHTDFDELKAAVLARADEIDASSDRVAAAIQANIPTPPTP